MNFINEDNLILEKQVFVKEEIEKRMTEGGFNNLSKFELFIWDLEMFLQLQKKLGDKIILKGGAATQFYVPVSFQRTSIDIDMICLASRIEVHRIITEIEKEFEGVGEYCKFRLYEPKHPKLGLDALETYFETVPSICTEQDLFATKGKQEVKIEFIFSHDDYTINKIKQPKLFAFKTKQVFNVLAFEELFADKLTTIGPNTIGISDERADEQLKQVYDVITLFVSNIDQVFANKKMIKSNYRKVALNECIIHGIDYDSDLLYEDMKVLTSRIKSIESDIQLFQRANDFQALYLRRSANRDKAEWAIVGFQLDLLIDFIFKDDTKVLSFREINELLEKLKFEHIRGPERGKIIKAVRNLLEENFGKIAGLSLELFNKRIDRIVWELILSVGFPKIQESLSELLSENEN